MFTLLAVLAAQAISQVNPAAEANNTDSTPAQDIPQMSRKPDAQVLVGDPASDLAIKRTEQISDQIFDCVNAQIKAALLAHALDATPKLLTDSALSACQYLKKPLFEALTSPGNFISPAAAEKIVEGEFQTIRMEALKVELEQLERPEVANLRLKMIVGQWKKCVIDKAANWSRLRDDAATIGRAAVTACEAFKENDTAAAAYYLKGGGASAEGATKIADGVEGKLIDLAVEVVVSTRAGRLPRH